MPPFTQTRFFRLLVAVLMPILATGIQWYFWEILNPLTWVLLYPSIFLSAAIGGFFGGLLGTLIAASSGIFFFTPPQFSFHVSETRHIISLIIFFTMGILGSIVFEKFHKTLIEVNALSKLKLDRYAARLDQSLTFADAGIWEWDVQSGEVFWSDSLWRLYGLKQNSCPASYENWLKSIALEDQENIQLAMQKAVAGNTEINLEWRVHSSLDNQTHYLMSRGQPLLNDNGQLKQYRGIVVDITKRKQFEEKLQESQANLKAVLEHAPYGIVVIGNDGKIEFINTALTRILGYKHADIPDVQTMFERSYPDPDYRQAVLATWEQNVVSNDDVYHKPDLGKVFKVTSSDGRELDIEFHVIRLPDHRITITLSDITERIKMQEELDNYRKHLESLIDERSGELLEANRILKIRSEEIADLYNQAPCGYHSLDSNGLIVAINDTELNWLGYRREEIESHLNFAQIISADSQIIFKKNFPEFKKKGEIRDLEIELVRKDGSVLSALVNAAAVYDEEGNYQFSRSTLFDNSERKMRNLQIEKLNTELTVRAEESEAANKAKSAFLANMSHEIRTPMNAVLGFCYLLEQKSLDNDTRDLVVKIHNAGRSLLNIINDILDFSKIEAGRIDLERSPFHLHALLEHIGSVMLSLAGSKRLELIISPPPQITSLIGDEMRLQQVLTNLLGNAIKFTDAGEVSLLVTCEQANAHEVWLRFAIKDTGIGLSEQQLSNLFQAFSQADSSISRRFGGTGLGLTISQRLINLMGGELKVNSRLGKGSEFFFVLPFERSQELAVTPDSLNNLSVLIADDSDIARDALYQTVKSLGWRADLVNSGEALIAQMLQRLSNQQAYDVLLVDWMMPTMDGLTAAKNLRDCLKRSQRQTARPPIVLMVTAYSREQVMSQSGMEAIDGVLTKPVTPSSLHDAISRLINADQNVHKPDEASLPPGNRIAGLRLLVVDDSDINREVAKRILESEGAIVTLADDGQYAVDWLLAHEDAVDLVLMDIQMPRLDGYAATRKIRLHPKFSQLPILALTAGAFQSLQDTALNAGMNDFIAKPFNVNLMLGKIRHWTGYEPQPEAALQTTLPPVDTVEAKFEPATAKHGESLPKLTGIDLVRGLKIWGNIKDFQIYLLRFIEQYQAAGHEIHGFVVQGNIAAIKTLAHKLKGSAFSLALTQIADLSSQIEACSDNPEKLRQVADQLQAELNQLRQTLDAWIPGQNGSTPAGAGQIDEA